MQVFPPDLPQHRPGILFAEDFDDINDPAPIVVLHEPEIFTPAITEDDLAEARREGFEAGQRASREEAMMRLQDAARLSCERLGDLAQRLEASREVHLHNTVDAAAKLIFAALLTALPSLSERQAAPEILHLVRNTITGLTQDETMTVTVSPDCIAPLREAVASEPRAIERRVNLEADDAMAPGDARLTWQGGAATRNAALAELAIGDILRSLDLLPTTASSTLLLRPASATAEPANPYLESTHG